MIIFWLLAYLVGIFLTIIFLSVSHAVNYKRPVGMSDIEEFLVPAFCWPLCILAVLLYFLMLIPFMKLIIFISNTIYSALRYFKRRKE